VKLNAKRSRAGLKLGGKRINLFLSLALGAWTAIPALGQNLPGEKRQGESEKYTEELAREVHHQLSVLPYVSVFDHIAFTLKGNNVTLTGQVVRHTLRTEAEAAVKSLEGVGSVVNQIEELPASPGDDELRSAVYRAIYEDEVLSRYATVELPSIHIIVKNGNVALEGQVESEADKNRAMVRAAMAANVAGVKNNLIVRAKEEAKK